MTREQMRHALACALYVRRLRRVHARIAARSAGRDQYAEWIEVGGEA